MSYMLLIVEPPEQRRERGPVAGRACYESMQRYAQDLAERGLLIAGDSLSAPSGGVRVQVHQGERRLTDGPFAEAKEFVGGFFLVDVATREEALELASLCPAAQWCTVEVRQSGPCYE